MPDAEIIQQAFDLFFRAHPRLRKIQRNVDTLCTYLRSRNHPFPYDATALALAYAETEHSLEFIPVPVPNPPQPPKQGQAPDFDDRLELLPRLPGESSFGQLQRSAEANALKTFGRNPPGSVIRNGREETIVASGDSPAGRRADAFRQANANALEDSSQNARDRLKARGRG